MIYLDYAATTPCAPQVIDAMLPFFRDRFANASSTDHRLGAEARTAVEHARGQIAELIGAQQEDIILVSGSTEANNLALETDLPISSTRIEHPSVIDTIEARKDDRDTWLPLSAEGLVSPDGLAADLKQRRCLVSIIATNNETGVEQDLDMLAETVSAAHSLLHVDATQAVATRNIDTRRRGIAGCSISAHKLYGPKGIGALAITADLRKELRPILYGGGHERGLRSGTLNVPAIVGFGVAAELARKHREERRNRLSALNEAFFSALLESTGGAASKTIASAQQSPHILSVRINGVNARALLIKIRDEVAISLGSACSTNKNEPSHVLLAMGLDKRQINETFRCSFSSEQSLNDVHAAADLIGKAARGLAGFAVSA